jgi:alkyl hydroperoxide reductase subunit AhpC
VCGSELALYNELLPEFQRFGATLLGISVDGAWCHIAYARESKLKLPLLADLVPMGAVARAYGVYRQHDETAEHALFVFDYEGIIRWSYVSPVGVVAGADGILTALQALTVKEKTP